jgi:DNA-binding response OmpR family regulator
LNILVCDDDRDIVNAIEIYLRNEGYRALKAYNGQEALDTLEQEEIQLLIMDIMMPKLDGLAATTRIREAYNVPILLLSAKAEDTDKVLGLHLGADDYLTKPFNPIELIARVKSLLRRYTRLGSIALDSAGDIARTGELIIDDRAKLVTVDGEEVKLTPIEYGILLFLTRHAGQVFSIQQIYEAVWQEPAYNAENTVTVHIRRIREKIEINPKSPKYLKVVWGVGYKIEKLAL